MSDIEGDVMTEEAPADAQTPEVPEVEQVSSVRLVATLAVAGILAGLLLVVVFKATQPAILANKKAARRAAINEVLKDPAHYETLYVVDGRLSKTAPEGVKEDDADRVFLGFDGQGAPVGFAVEAGEACFQDMVNLIFGYEPRSSTVIGMRVLENKETPGLGDKIVKDQAYVNQFDGVVAPIVPVKAGQKSASNPADLETITGATISSKGVVRIINNRLEKLRPILEAYTLPEGNP